MKYFLILAFCISATFHLSAQKTGAYTNEFVQYDDAVDLFDKEKYTAAYQKFDQFIESNGEGLHDARIMHANFYRAVCAMELYHDDADYRFMRFVEEYPESPRLQSAYFKLGVIKYRDQNWNKAVEWFDKVDKFQLTKDELSEYYFKRGYAHFMEENYKVASADFREIKDVESQYQDPAIYYYSHIAYMDGNYQTALEGFEKLKDKKGFDKIVPYYITQIYYRQEKYDLVLSYGGPLLDTITPQKKAEIANMVGDAYYQQEKYDEALPFLHMHMKEVQLTTAEKYRIAYCYYMIEDYDQASKYFEWVSRNDDPLGQNALYYMGECFEYLDKKNYAQNAYQAASEMEYDPEIQEDALFRFAKLAYELSLNPYDEAIDAFQRYLQKYPNTERADDAYQYLVNVYLTTKNYDAALESLEKLDMKDVRLQRAYQLVLYNRAVELQSNSRYEDAIKYYKRVDEYPVDRELSSLSKYWIGECNYYMGNYPVARTYYNQFIKSPGAINTDFYGDAHYNIAYTYLKEGDNKSALDEFRQYVSKPGSNEIKLNDAYLRIADGFFMQDDPDDERAIEYYGKSLDLNIAHQDYALFQRGLSYGYIQQPEKKVVELEKLLQQYSGSIRKVNALYQLGEAYRVMNKFDKAIKYYEQVAEQYSSNILATKSLLYLGLLHKEVKQYNQAIDAYILVLENNPSPDDCRDAVFGLKDVYVAKDQLEKWDNIVSRYNCVDSDQRTLDSTFFAETVNKYHLEDNCEKIIANVDRYTSRYPNGIYVSHALFYKAECLYHDEKVDESQIYYENILNLPQNEYTETALLRTAAMYYNQEKYQEAFTNFNNLEKMASNAENLLISKIGQMRCFYKLGDYPYAKNYATEVLAEDQTPENIKVQAQLILGMSLMHTNQLDRAIDELVKVNQMTTSVLGAEAQYHVALIYFKKEDTGEVEKQILKLIKQKPSYDYWVAKGYILLADNLLLKGDVFQAKHTLQSVIDNYVGDDDIVPTAKAKLKAIIESEKEEEEGRETRSMMLDLGGDDDVIKGDDIEEAPDKEEEESPDNSETENPNEEGGQNE